MRNKVLTVAEFFTLAREASMAARDGIHFVAEGETAMSTEIVTVVDYFNLGEKVSRWAKGELPWPTTIQDLENALGNSAGIPARYTKLLVVQGNHETLVLHLPEAQPLSEAETQAAALPDSSAYPLPDFYRMASLPGIEMLHGRIGDYCMAQCK